MPLAPAVIVQPVHAHEHCIIVPIGQRRGGSSPSPQPRSHRLPTPDFHRGRARPASSTDRTLRRKGASGLPRSTSRRRVARFSPGANPECSAKPPPTGSRVPCRAADPRGAPADRRWYPGGLRAPTPSAFLAPRRAANREGGRRGEGHRSILYAAGERHSGRLNPPSSALKCACDPDAAALPTAAESEAPLPMAEPLWRNVQSTESTAGNSYGRRRCASCEPFGPHQHERWRRYPSRPPLHCLDVSVSAASAPERLTKRQSTVRELEGDLPHHRSVLRGLFGGFGANLQVHVPWWASPWHCPLATRRGLGSRADRNRPSLTPKTTC